MQRDWVPPAPQPDAQDDELSGKVLGAAIEVHRVLGPGLTESMYEEALCHELDLLGIQYERQLPVAVMYKGKKIGDTRLDLLIEGQLIVDLKACDGLTPVHRAQMICYLHVTGHRVGLLINFNVAILKDGIRRVILSQ